MAKELTAPRLAHVASSADGYARHLTCESHPMTIESYRRDQQAFRALNRKAKINLARRCINELPDDLKREHMKDFAVNSNRDGKRLTAWVEELLHMGGRK